MACKSNQKFGLLLLFILIFSSCSKFQEHYFLRDNKNRLGELPNYYRVTVEGKASGSSRFIAGWYNEKAVDAYFNEITPKTNQTFQQEESEDENKLVSINNDDQDKKLVLLLSSNSDVIASQIGAFAENEQIVDAFTRLSNKPTFLEGYEASQSLSHLESLIQNAQVVGNSTINKLEESATNVEIVSAIIQYLNLLSAQLGNAVVFTNIDEAEKWWLQNRYLILNK